MQIFADDLIGAIRLPHVLINASPCKNGGHKAPVLRNRNLHDEFTHRIDDIGIFGFSPVILDRDRTDDAAISGLQSMREKQM